MKRLLIVATLVFANIAPSYAISDAYRRQLQREHKTQQAELRQVVRAPKFKPIHAHVEDIDFKRGADGIAYINGAAAAHDESTQAADVYSAGLISVIVYKTGKINAMEDGRLVGRLK